MWFIRLGTKITGPYTREQLRTLRARGQFSPHHQISTDRLRWEPAAPLVQLLDGTEVRLAVLVSSNRGPGTADDGNAWHYLDANKVQVGPRTHSELSELLRSGQISSGTLVCRSGDKEWKSIRETPALADLLAQGFGQDSQLRFLHRFGRVGIFALRSLRFLLKQGNPLLLAGVLLGLLYAAWALRGGTVVSGPLDESGLKSAVGLVVGTFHMPRADGTLGQKTSFGTGTAFVISADGYLMTNDHVAAMGDELFVKENLRTKYSEIASAISSRAAETQDQQEQQSMVSLATVMEQMSSLCGQPQTAVRAELRVLFDGVPFEARIVHRESQGGRDMAILKIERKNGPYFALCGNGQPKQGVKHWIAGFPGVASEARTAEAAAIEEMNEKTGRDPIESLLPSQMGYSLTEGIVNRVVEQHPSRLWEIEHGIQMSQGNSGGPMFREDGTVVGLVNAYVKSGDNRQNLAQSIAQFRKVLEAHVQSDLTWRE